MASLEVLPENWMEKAVVCSDPSFEGLKKNRGTVSAFLGQHTVQADDACLFKPLIIVVDERGNLFQLVEVDPSLVCKIVSV